MIAITDAGWLIVTTHGRTVQIQKLTDESYYRALRSFGVSQTIAQALAKGLITVKVKSI